MPVLMSLDARVAALISDVDADLRKKLQKVLRLLREAGDEPEVVTVPAVIMSVSRIFEGPDGLLCMIAEAANYMLKGFNIDKKIEELQQRGILPAEIASDIHWIRVYSNKARHNDEKKTLMTNDAEVALDRILNVVQWFYCKSEHGPQLPAIYSEPIQPLLLAQKTIREVTAAECYKIKFLGGEGGMDKGYYRKLTVRGRTSADQTEIAQAVENLIRETLLARGRLANHTTVKRRTEESDHGESWPIVSLDDRIMEKCGIETKGQLRALLLTDEPGGGKSTTARNVAWRVAVNASPFENEQRVPVYIRLRDWENAKFSPFELTSYLGVRHANDSRHSSWPEEAFWEEALGEEKSENGRLFLVLDGLDELSSRRRFAVDLLDEVQKLARQGNVVLITCRTRSLRAYKSKLTDFEIVRINGLDPEEMQAFVHNYPGLPNPDKLVRQLSHQPAMLQLVREPFLLDVICYLAAQERGELPECRSELIEKAIDQLLLSPESAEFNWPNDDEPAVNTLRRVLARASLLLRLQERKGQIYNLFSSDTFEDAVQRALQQETLESPNATVLTHFYSRLRFLQIPGERELSREGIGSFSHSLFLDFLAAEGLKQIIQPSATDETTWNLPVNYFPKSVSPNTLVAVKAFDPAWFELLSFLPSLLVAPRRFFEILGEENDDLSRRRATLAICALGELPSGTLKDEEVMRWVEPLAQSCWDIAAIHWRLGVTSLAETLIAEISCVGRAYPGLVERMADDLRSPILQTRLDALAGLGRIGMAATPVGSVIEGLLYNLLDATWSVRRLASATLAKMGPLAVRPTFERLEKSDEWYELASACEAIGLMGATALVDKGIEVVAVLLRLLSHKQPVVRSSACEALGNLGPGISNFEEVLREMTTRASATEQDATVRAQACAALGKYGAVAASSEAVLNSLISSLANDDWVVRTSASTALSELARESNVNRLHLVNELTRYLDSTSVVRASICLTFGKLHSVFSSYADTIEQLLVTHLGDKDLVVCTSASEAIRNLGIRIADRGIFNRLLASLEDPDWQVRAYAVEALGNLRDFLVEGGEQVLDHLFMNLRDSRWHVRASSCEVLGELAHTLVSARPIISQKLIEVLNTSEPTLIDLEGYVSVKAIRALGKVGLIKANSTETMQYVAGFLQHDNWQVQIAACEAFADIGPEAAEVHGVLPGLMTCLKSKVWCVRSNACKTLGRIAALLTGKEGIEELIACVCDAQQPVRTEAAETLMRLAGAGNKGMRFVLNAQRMILSAQRKGEAALEMPFPKPTPPLFALNLPHLP